MKSILLNLINIAVGPGVLAYNYEVSEQVKLEIEPKVS
jgi:copper oxidase (laccase) domain-containing protein